ncbi:MAG TPA: hypothetical protein VFJ87_10505 [Rhodanobacteraceae bacterium]|nr:hypothetical protein [Rhodanobacteraceae bacterium]
MADQGTRALPRIAFVFGDASLAEHVRDAVTGHAEITYSVPAQDFDAARLVDAQVASALVNVDGGDWLDEIESRLNAAGVPVVFNDPDYSRGLDGWDRARWLRHLTAKLCGSDDYDPPRPVAVADAPDAAPAEVDTTAPAAVAEVASDETNSPGATDDPEADGDLAAGEPASRSSDAVAERPLSPHEIETMTADFVATPELHTKSASSWQPTAVTVQVSAQPSVAARLPEATPQSGPATPEPVASEPAEMGPDASTQPAIDPPQASDQDATTDLLDVDTEALSAMIDERLAQPEASAGLQETWDVPGATAGDMDAPADPALGDPVPSDDAAAGMHTIPVADVSEAPASDPDADVLASLPSLDDWQLLDADAMPEAAKSGSGRVASELPDSLSDLSLVPMDPTGDIPINTDPIERWIDEAEGRTKPKGDGDKA